MVKIPGRLPSGYGQESNVNMFHRGTIFWDAASKIIHDENQVSLGAGETLVSKVSFEEWPWEILAAQVKHYHSNNGIFPSAEFHKQCKEDSQRQSFSGVGAQHQNVEAERSIQTVMYMA